MANSDGWMMDGAVITARLNYLRVMDTERKRKRKDFRQQLGFSSTGQWNANMFLHISSCHIRFHFLQLFKMMNESEMASSIHRGPTNI